MKEIQIKKDFDYSYLLINDENLTDSYIIRMLTQNSIPGILSCKKYYENENVYLAYDITSKKSLEKKYIDQKMSFSDLTELFYGISKSMKSAKEYLLEYRGFVFLPQCIFYDLESEEIDCLYIPEQFNMGNEEKERYHPLADFILDRIDHREEHAVNLAYHFYKISKEEFFSFETFLHVMEKEIAMSCAQEKRMQDAECVEFVVENGNRPDYDEIENKDWKDNEYHEEQFYEIEWKYIGILFGVGLVFVLAYLLVKGLRKYALYILIPGLLVLAMAILLLIRNIILLYKNSIEEKYMEPEKPVRVEEYFDNIADDVTVYFDRDEYLQLKWKEGRFSKEFALTEYPVTVGKMKDSVQVVIDDNSVSRLHAKLRKQDNKVYIQDLDSTNGTFVNGRQILVGEERIINRGDEIQFGKIIVNVV